MDETKAKVRAFLGRFFRHDALADGDDIFALGFVNSLIALQLVNFVESEFGVRVEDEDLDLDNFRSIDRIAGLIERKTGAHAGV